MAIDILLSAIVAFLAHVLYGLVIKLDCISAKFDMQKELNKLLVNYLSQELDDESDLRHRLKEIKKLSDMVCQDECE